MADPQTANLQLFIPLNGADPGTWDVPANANSAQLEAVLTGAPSVPLSNLPVTLSAAQYNASQITFTGTLTAVVTVTFPAFARNWTLFNNCLGNPQSLTVICKTSASTVFVALPPSEPIQVFSDGTNLRFLGLDRVGAYLDIGSTTVPAWITNSTPAPYLNCDGTSFSSATYPALRDYLGSNVLPDSKGSFRAAIDQGSGRYGFGFLANVGTQFIQQGHIPNYALSVTDPGHVHTTNNLVTTDVPAGNTPNNAAGTGIGTVSQTNSATTGITVNSAGSGTRYTPPSYAGGLTLIRAG